VFLVLSGYRFYTSLGFFVLMGGTDLARGLWQYQLLDVEGLLLVLVPLLTMRLFAEERKLGTLELLWTYPVRDAEIVAGKFLACVAVVVLLVAATAVHAAILARFYPVAPGPLVAGYGGLVLLGAAFVGCGLFVSALTESQLVAAQVLLLLVGLGGVQAAAERTNRRFDLTPGRELSLAPVTRKLLADVTAPLHVTVFFRRGTRQRYADLVRLSADANPHIDFELLDLDRFPERARSLGVSSYGRAAIEYAGRRAVVLAAPEEERAGGIRRVVQGRSRRLVFTTGHGEPPPGG